MRKILISYYSRRGQNYVSGNIVELEKGNTEVIAHKIAQQIDADLFHIDTVVPYPEDYMATTEKSKEELRAKARPELTDAIVDMEQYDTIILGYPNWWGTMPMAVFTFLETYNFSGKTIIPFCTHEGSGLGRSVRDIKTACPTANVQSGIAIHGTSAEHADREVEQIVIQLQS